MPDKRTHPDNLTPPDSGRRAAIKTGIAGTAALAAMATGSVPATAQEPTPGGVLSGQVALVTGAARGIGRAIAVAYAKAGADVAALDIADPDAYREALGYPLGSEAELDETVAMIEAEGRRALKIKADVSNLAAMRDAVAHVVDTFGTLDTLVANAGVGATAPLHEMTEDRWKTVIDINLNGAANSMIAALPMMIDQRAGRIITVTSIAGRMGSASSSNYAASKWGLIGLTKTAAIDSGPYGITVNAIAPTGVRTGIFGGLQNDPEWLEGYESILSQLHTLPVGILEPEDMTGTAVFLASPAAKYITGAVIDVAAGANARYTA